MKQIIAGVFAALLLSCQANCFASDATVPLVQDEKLYRDMLNSKRFADLEQEFKVAGNGDAQNGSGQSKLHILLYAMSRCISADCDGTADNQTWDNRLALLNEWKRNFPKSPYSELALVDYYVSRGYAVRGGNSAANVAPNVLQTFDKYIATANELLQHSSAIAKSSPIWYAEMLDVGTAQQWPKQTMLQLFNDGVKIGPRYYPIYIRAGRNFLPMWNGSDKELKEFLDAISTNRNLSESDASIAYVRVVQGLAGFGIFNEHVINWEKMKSGMDLVWSAHPDPWNSNLFAKYACYSGDKNTTIHFLSLMGKRPIEAAWENNMEIYFQCVQWTKKSGK